jgi:hypothetical protein
MVPMRRKAGAAIAVWKCREGRGLLMHQGCENSSVMQVTVTLTEAMEGKPSTRLLKVPFLSQAPTSHY